MNVPLTMEGATICAATHLGGTFVNAEPGSTLIPINELA